MILLQGDSPARFAYLWPRSSATIYNCIYLKYDPLIGIYIFIIPSHSHKETKLRN